MTGLGTVTVTAMQSGNAQFEAAPPVSRSFRILDQKRPEVRLEETLSKSTGEGRSIRATARDNYKLSVIRYRILKPNGDYTPYHEVPVTAGIGEGQKIEVTVLILKPGDYVVEIQAMDSGRHRSEKLSITVTK